ncbi:MAG: pyridoxamine 5'-phosphate oxidase family protein [Candidatus Omnitrophica bacterium]|nr:pyridoxamine 5'-phosphate oxidase family protein [Candidatus Omnitrophota bacterium]
MNWDKINAAIEIAEKLQYFFIATADKEGCPHVTTAGEIRLKSEEVVEVSFWFCPKTIDNLEKNKQVSLIIWDAGKNAGYQLLGKAEDVEVAQVMDEADTAIGEEKYLLQARWFLVVRVDTVMEFIHALHNDVAL